MAPAIGFVLLRAIIPGHRSVAPAWVMQTRPRLPTTPGCPARLAVAGTLALMALEALWELVLAPLGAHASWLALKALPLALLTPALLRGDRRPRQWLALLLPFYVAEALARALVEPGRHAIVAATTCAVALATFVALLGWFRGESLGHRKHGPLDDA